MTRQGSSSKFPDGVKVASVDYSDEVSVAEALQGQDALIIVLAVSAPHDTQTKIIKAASEAGVKYIMPNAQAFDPEDQGLLNDTGLIGMVNGIQGAFSEGGSTQYILLNNSFWYEFSLSEGESTYGFNMADKTVTFIDDGNKKIPTSTWDQCGRAVTGLMSLPVYPVDENDQSTTLSQFGNSHVFIKSFELSQRDMLDSLNRVLGTSDADWKIEKQGHKERYDQGNVELQAGKNSGFAKRLYTRMFYPGALEKFSARAHNKVLGLPEEDLDEATRRAVEMASAGRGDYGDNEEAYKRRLELARN